MATVTKWTPFGVALNVTATAATVTRTSATQFTVDINASWKCYWSGNKTNYGMSAASGGVTKTISAFGTSRASGSASFTGTYSISGYGAQTKSITVTFRNFNNDNGNAATKAVTLSVSVPAWPSYKVSYNANGGSGAPSAQTKYKNAALTLSSTKPTRTGYAFKNWNTASGGGGTSYNPGASYTANAAATLYAQWTARTYTVTLNANGGTGGPGSATKTYNKALTLPTTAPTRANYTFLGWSESTTATEATYLPGGTYGKNITSDATLYAVWALAYHTPLIKGLTVGRCGQDGSPDDFGAYLKAEFSWECCQLLGSNPVASVKVGYRVRGSGEYQDIAVTPSGTTQGAQAVVLGGALDPDSMYDVRVVVADSSSNSPNSTTATRSLASSAYVMDFLRGGKGAAFGKVAEMEGLDLNWTALFRKNLTMANNVFLGANNAAGAWRNIIGMDDSGNLLIGWGPYESKDGNTAVYGNKVVLKANEGITADHEIHSDHDDTAFNQVHPTTGVSVGFGVGSGGNNHGVYSKTMGGWLLSGNGENIALWSPNGAYKPYFTAGDTVNIAMRTAGFCTSSKSQIQFCVPLGKPIYGISSVTVKSQTDGGLKLRQGGSYTHGSGASTYAKPASYSAAYNPHGYVNVYATYNATTNAVNNEAIGVETLITLTFNA